MDIQNYLDLLNVWRQHFCTRTLSWLELQNEETTIYKWLHPYRITLPFPIYDNPHIINGKCFSAITVCMMTLQCHHNSQLIVPRPILVPLSVPTLIIYNVSPYLTTVHIILTYFYSLRLGSNWFYSASNALLFKHLTWLILAILTYAAHYLVYATLLVSLSTLLPPSFTPSLLQYPLQSPSLSLFSNIALTLPSFAPPHSSSPSFYLSPTR